jgi:hypothetical protein
MKRMRFLDEDLEKRAGVLLKSGTFVKLKKVKKETFALYELYGYFVEVVVQNKEVKSMEFIPNSDTERLASYVKTKEFKDFLKRELSI